MNNKNTSWTFGNSYLKMTERDKTIKIQAYLIGRFNDYRNGNLREILKVEQSRVKPQVRKKCEETYKG